MTDTPHPSTQERSELSLRFDEPFSRPNGVIVAKNAEVVAEVRDDESHVHPARDSGLARDISQEVAVDIDFTRTTGCDELPISARGLQQSADLEAPTGSRAQVVARSHCLRIDVELSPSESRTEVLSMVHTTVPAKGSAIRVSAAPCLRRNTMTHREPHHVARLIQDADQLRLEPLRLTLVPVRTGSLGATPVVPLNDKACEISATTAVTG